VRFWRRESVVVNTVDGNLAKQLTEPISAVATVGSERVKRTRTIACVLGAFKYDQNSHLVGSLVLGLLDEDGNFRQIGESSILSYTLKRRLTHHLESLRRTRFKANNPDGSDRCWTSGQGDWIPVIPELVIEVEYEHFMDGRFRRETKIVGVCSDKPAHLCTFEQLAVSA